MVSEDLEFLQSIGVRPTIIAEPGKNPAKQIPWPPTEQPRSGAVIGMLFAAAGGFLLGVLAAPQFHAAVLWLDGAGR